MTDQSWPAILARLFAGDSISSGEASWAMQRIMEGEATPAQFGAFVAALRAKGETVDEIVGLVETMRSMSLKVEAGLGLVDTCGTGGDRAGTINVSTIAALVVAGAGGRVAKHGNRSASSICGSADVLEELGVKIELGPAGVKACIEEAGIGFCFAPVFHPAMRHAGQPRREIGVPTIFNFLGPLTNPAEAKHQAIGVSDPAMALKMAEVLRRLGSTRVLVFHGSDGLDEISTTGPSTIWDLKEGSVTEAQIDPTDFGIPAAEAEDLKGGSSPENAKIVLQVLDRAAGPARDVVVINAAAAIIAAGLAEEFPAAIEMAAESIDSGKARRALDDLIEVSNRPLD